MITNIREENTPRENIKSAVNERKDYYVKFIPTDNNSLYI